MPRIVVVGSLLVLIVVHSTRALGWVRLGTGFSTITSGRTIPALALGVDIGKDWNVSCMFGGVQTEYYYSSGVALNALSSKDWGDFWFGRLIVGFGAGAYYAEKGIYTSLEENGDLSHLQKDYDNTFGPAFRVAFKPLSHFYISIEYLMGVGSSVISNAWEDVGMGAIGFEL